MLFRSDVDRPVQHIFRQFSYLASNCPGVRQPTIAGFQPLKNKVPDEPITVDCDQLLLSRAAGLENAKFVID